jgi:hypothetical protein
LLLVLVPTVLVMLSAARAPRLAFPVAIVLTMVLLVNAIVANSLTFRRPSSRGRHALPPLRYQYGVAPL